MGRISKSDKRYMKKIEESKVVDFVDKDSKNLKNQKKSRDKKTVTKENDDLRSKLAALTEELKKLTVENSFYEVKDLKILKNAKDLKIANTELVYKNVYAEREIAELRSELEGIKEGRYSNFEIDKRDRQIRNLQEEVKVLIDEIDILVDQKNKNMTSMLERERTLDSTNRLLEKENKKIKRELKAAKNADTVKMEIILEKVKTNAHNLKQEVKTLKNEIKNIKNKTSKAKTVKFVSENSREAELLDQIARLKDENQKLMTSLMSINMIASQEIDIAEAKEKYRNVHQISFGEAAPTSFDDI